MHCLTFLLAILATCLSLTAALPITSSESTSLLGRSAARKSPASYHITNFIATSIPHSEDAKVIFDIESSSDDPRRAFKTHCFTHVVSGTAYQSLIPVKSTSCENPLVTFTFKPVPLTFGPDYKGWKLVVRHQYVDKSGFLRVTIHDVAEHLFPKSHIKIDGQNTGMYQHVRGPHELTLKAPQEEPY